MPIRPVEIKSHYSLQIIVDPDGVTVAGGPPPLKVSTVYWFKDDESMRGTGQILMQIGKQLIEQSSGIILPQS